MKKIFGFGPSEIEQKAIDFCKLRNKGHFEENFENLFSDLLISSDDPELENILKQIRNKKIESIKEIYENAKINPFLRFLKINKIIVQRENQMKLD